MRIVVIAGLADSLINFRGPLLAEMVRAGHDVTAISPGENTMISEKLRQIGVDHQVVEFERTGMSPLGDFRAMFRLLNKLRLIRPDMVLAYTVKPVIYGSMAAALAGVPRRFSMITGLGYAFTGKTLKHRAVRQIVSALYRLSLEMNDRVFFQNPDDAAQFASLGLVRAERTVLINGSGVDLDHFSPSSTVTGSVGFLLIARLLRDKGIFEYVKAAEILKKQYKNTLFRLVGPYDSNPAGIRAGQVGEWQESGLIDYLGECEDVRPYIADSTVYVLPSYREGTPRTVLEAMAMGKPVITTDVPGCRQTVTDGDNGFLVPAKNVEALARAMEHFILEPELVAKMGRRSREIAEERFDVRKVNRVILSAMGLIDEKGV